MSFVFKYRASKLFAPLPLVFVAAMAFAAQAAAAPKWGELDQAVGKENYVEAKKLADAIMQGGTPEDRVKTSKVYGRILLALGQKELASQYLAVLKKSDPSGGKMTAIYDAWFKALDGKPDEGIKALEKVLANDTAHNEMTAEAADVLAMLYMAGGDQERAKKAVDQGMRALQYLGTKDGYLLTLLQNRLSSNIVANQAKRMYDEAEKHRAEKKFAEAVQIFAQIRLMYPKNEWAHAAGFRIGECFLGMERPAQAADAWQKFIKESPAGPWRGQAYVAMVDLALQLQLDLKRATELTLAATATLGKPLDKEAAPSWKEAGYGLYLRHGIVSLADARFEAAAQAFQQAKDSNPKLPPPSPETLAGLDRLIEASKQKWRLIPEELAGGDPRATVALTLGNIYSILHQYDLAKGYFGSVMNGPVRSRSAAHRSFAGFGLARVLAVTADKGGKPSSSPAQGRTGASVQLSAKAVYEASLKECPNGSWHDETLFSLATMIQEEADAKFGKPAKSVADGKGRKAKADSGKAKTGDAVPRSTPQLEAKAEKERLAALLKAKSEALLYWQDLIQRYPRSPRCEQAFYSAGVLLYEMAEAAPAGKSEQLWQDAASRLSRFCLTYPKSCYAGDAYVRQIDIELEQKYDVKAAMALAEQGIQWAKSQNVKVVTKPDGTATPESVAEAAKTITTAATSVPSWGQIGAKPAASLLNDLYNVYYRAAVLAYIQERFDDVAQYLGAAGSAHPVDGMEANFDMERFGIHILGVCAKRREPAWWPDAIAATNTDSQKLVLKLADTYLHSQRPAKAVTVYQHLLAGDSSMGRPNKAVESYCLMQLALAYSVQRINYDKSIENYKRFLKKDYAEYSWAATAIMRLAVLEYNTTHDAKHAATYYQYVLERYPNHPNSERALYFLALAAVKLGDKTLAEASCHQYLDQYARSGWKNSGWRDHLQKILDNEIPRLSDNKGKQ